VHLASRTTMFIDEIKVYARAGHGGKGFADVAGDPPFVQVDQERLQGNRIWNLVDRPVVSCMTRR
jgi:hypothetical protein